MPDPFDVLGLPARFDLPPEAVERAYLAGVAACHPDLAGDDPERQDEVSRRAAALNRAKSVLLDPEARARALLARFGGGGGDDRELPEGFLGSILETRMAVEEAAASGDQAEIARLRAWADAERAGYITRVGRLFRRGEPDTREVLRQLNAWRYIERMLEQVGHS